MRAGSNNLFEQGGIVDQSVPGRLGSAQKGVILPLGLVARGGEKERNEGKKVVKNSREGEPKKIKDAKYDLNRFTGSVRRGRGEGEAGKRCEKKTSVEACGRN